LGFVAARLNGTQRDPTYGLLRISERKAKRCGCCPQPENPPRLAV